MKQNTLTNLLEKFRLAHGDKYDYSKVVYKNCFQKVEIICLIHGPFFQQPRAHYNGQNCPKCTQRPNWKSQQEYTQEHFIIRARAKHKNFYSYSETNYISNKIPIIVICPKHGKFNTVPNSHLNGHGCAKCANNEKLTIDKFIEKARSVHGDLYDYSQFTYVNATSKGIHDAGNHKLVHSTHINSKKNE